MYVCIQESQWQQKYKASSRSSPYCQWTGNKDQPPSFILLSERSSMFPHMRWKRQHSSLSQEGPTFLCTTSLNVHNYLRDCDVAFQSSFSRMWRQAGCCPSVFLIKKCHIWNLKEPNDMHEGRSFSQGADISPQESLPGHSETQQKKSETDIKGHWEQ